MAPTTPSGNKGIGSMFEIFIRYLSKTAPGLLFLHLVWLIIVSAVLSTSYIFAFHFTSLLNIYQEAHNIRNFSANLMVSASQDRDINNALHTLLDQTHSNRAYISRYHNGLAAVNGVPFFFQTLTHEVITPGTPRVMQFEQHVPASINIAMNNQFMQNRCAIVVNSDSDRDSQNYWYYQIRNAKHLIRCPIYMANGDLFGFIGIDYVSNTTNINMEQMRDRVKEMSSTISSIFARR